MMNDEDQQDVVDEAEEVEELSPDVSGEPQAVKSSGRMGAQGRGGKNARRQSGRGGKTNRPQARPRGRKEEAADPEGMRAIPTPTVGFPLWVKFAIPTAVIIAALLVLQGFLTSQQMLKELDIQINKRGADLAATVAEQVPESLWNSILPPGHDVARHGELPPRMLEEVTREARVALEKEWNAKLAAIVNNSVKTSGSGRKEIRDILVIDYKKGSEGVGEAYLRASAGGQQTKIATNSEGFKLGEVRIYSGRLEGEAVREFRIPVSRGGIEMENVLTPGYTGWVSVFLDAQAIEDITNKTKRNIYIITILGSIAAVVVIVLIATLFTRPIRQLQIDMALVASGNLEHKTSIDTNDEIGALAAVFDVMTDNLKMAQDQEADRKALERELSIATEIQENLLPQRVPDIPGFDIHRYYASAKEVGGDYYDFLILNQRHLGIVVADVSGKGIPGSMVMTMVRSLLRLASVNNLSPSDTFKRVNRILHRDIRRGMFVTAIYMVLDIVDKKLRVASAGHNPLVVFRAESNTVELVKPKGIALGFDRGPIFDANIREVEIELKPGDRIVAYTDGVNEAMDGNEEEFGDDKFYELVREHASRSSSEFTQFIVEALNKHRGDADQSDDITLATLAVQK